MKHHAYVPRATSYGLNPGDELNDLRMSDQVRPLFEHVKSAAALAPIALLGGDESQLSAEDQEKLTDLHWRDALSREVPEGVLTLWTLRQQAGQALL